MKKCISKKDLLNVNSARCPFQEARLSGGIGERILERSHTRVIYVESGLQGWRTARFVVGFSSKAAWAYFCSIRGRATGGAGVWPPTFTVKKF